MFRPTFTISAVASTEATTVEWEQWSVTDDNDDAQYTSEDRGVVKHYYTIELQINRLAVRIKNVAICINVSSDISPFKKKINSLLAILKFVKIRDLKKFVKCLSSN